MNNLPHFSTRISLANEAATEALAARLARLAQPGDVLALRGTLGAGKSTFARAFIRALTSPEEEVPSPTFTLLQTYDTDQGPVWHLDLYRLSEPEEALELDLEEGFATAICLIEWPDRLGRLLPASRLDLTLAADLGSVGLAVDARRVDLTGTGRWASVIREQFQ